MGFDSQEFEPRKVWTTWNPNRGALAYTGYDRPEVDDRLEIIMTKACIKKEGGALVWTIWSVSSP